MFDAEQPMADPARSPGEAHRQKLDSAWTTWKHQSALAAARPRVADDSEAGDGAVSDRIAVRLDALERQMGRLMEEFRTWRRRLHQVRRLAVVVVLLALTLALLRPIARPLATAAGVRFAPSPSTTVDGNQPGPRSEIAPNPIP